MPESCARAPASRTARSKSGSVESPTPWSSAGSGPSRTGPRQHPTGSPAPLNIHWMSAERVTVAERYVLEAPVSKGGMATVWKAKDEVLARTVAVKVLHPHLAE